MKGEDYFILNNEQDSVPRSSVGAGTITSVNNGMIKGVGTAFTTELNVNDYIYIQGQNDFRKIDSIQSDTELSLDRKFDVDLAGATYRITPANRFTEISGYVSGGSVGKLDGRALASNEEFNFSKGKGSTQSGNKYVGPYDVDATGTVIKITTVT